MIPTHYMVDTIIHPLVKGKREKGYRQAVEGPYLFDSGFKKGEALKIFMKQFGFCTGKVYVDGENGTPKEVGWTFEKKQKYDDSPGYYIQETWITLSHKCEICGGAGQIV